jgi:predicted amidohydrolase
MEEAHSTGCQLVVYPELALTTFFPRHWRDSTAEIDQWFEREMPSTYTRPLFEEAVRLQMSFYLGYAELASEQGGARHYNTSILVGPDGKVVGKYRKVHLPGHRDFRRATRSSSWKSDTSTWVTWVFRSGGIAM